MDYTSKAEWNDAKRKDWESVRPAKQKLTKQLSTKGAKLYSVHVGNDPQDRLTARIESWSTTSLAKLKKHTYIGISKKFRNVNLYIVQDGSNGTYKETISCSGDEGEEVLDEDYFSTAQKAIHCAIKRNAHDIKWSSSRPKSEPDEAFLDKMFNTERYLRDKLALSRLQKRLSKSL